MTGTQLWGQVTALPGDAEAVAARLLLLAFAAGLLVVACSVWALVRVAAGRRSRRARVRDEAIRRVLAMPRDVIAAQCDGIAAASSTEVVR